MHMKPQRHEARRPGVDAPRRPGGALAEETGFDDPRVEGGWLFVAGDLAFVQRGSQAWQWRVDRGAPPWLESSLPSSALIQGMSEDRLSSRHEIFAIAPSRAPVRVAYFLHGDISANASTRFGADGRVLRWGRDGVAFTGQVQDVFGWQPHLLLPVPLGVTTRGHLRARSTAMLDGRLYGAAAGGVRVVELCP